MTMEVTQVLACGGKGVTYHWLLWKLEIVHFFSDVLSEHITLSHNLFVLCWSLWYSEVVYTIQGFPIRDLIWNFGSCHNNFKIINSEIRDFQSRKLTILNSKIFKLPKSKKFKFTNLKILNSKTSHLQILNSQNTIFKFDITNFQHFLFWYWWVQHCNFYILFSKHSIIYEFLWCIIEKINFVR